MYGFVTTSLLFVMAMVIITIGEMVVSPVSQGTGADSLLKKCADVTWRSTVFHGESVRRGPYLAGLILDGPHPDYLWYAAGFIGILSTLVSWHCTVCEEHRK